MAQKYPIESLLRPPVEWITATAAFSAAALTFFVPSTLFMIAPVGYASAALLTILGTIRLFQGRRVRRYQRGLRQLPSYRMSIKQIPCDPHYLFLGQGFAWDARHTQRYWDATRAANRLYLQPQRLIQSQRKRLASTERRSGQPALHGVGMLEKQYAVRLLSSERQGHIFYAGTTGVGKTRAAEIAITQDIRSGSPTICIDPKGDAELFRCMYAEAKRAKRPFYFFHLGYPKQSARYNPIGRFSRITEVATRIANQLPNDGNAAAFRQFAWLFTNMIARALVALGRRPNYRDILRYMNDIEPLLIEYFEQWFDQCGPSDWRMAIASDEVENVLPKHLKGRDPRARRLVAYYRDNDFYDLVADGLRRAFEYEKTFFDKISVAVQPMLEKLLSGKIAELINPDYTDLDDQRPIIDWENAIRQRAVVYCGLDALTDPEISGVVGQAMVSDLVAYAGEIYKHGVGQGLPGEEAIPETKIHLDEFTELVRGPEIIAAVNKGRGAGFRFSVYTQSVSDVEAGFGDKARAAQVIGNTTNTIVMMRVADLATAELLTNRLPTVEVNMLMLVSGAQDSSSPESSIDFTSNTQERITTQIVPMLEPSALMELPRGHAFIYMHGGQLFKTVTPLVTKARGMLPTDLEEIANDMAFRYRSRVDYDYVSTVAPA